MSRFPLLCSESLGACIYNFEKISGFLGSFNSCTKNILDSDLTIWLPLLRSNNLTSFLPSDKIWETQIDIMGFKVYQGQE